MSRRACRRPQGGGSSRAASIVRDVQLCTDAAARSEPRATPSHTRRRRSHRARVERVNRAEVVARTRAVSCAARTALHRPRTPRPRRRRRPRRHSGRRSLRAQRLRCELGRPEFWRRRARSIRRCRRTRRSTCCRSSSSSSCPPSASARAAQFSACVTTRASCLSIQTRRRSAGWAWTCCANTCARAPRSCARTER